MHAPDSDEFPGTELLRLARGSIEYGLAHAEPLPVNCDEMPRTLTEPAASFTTLRLEGQLRGCCGGLEAVYPLAKDVVNSAFHAAFRDRRFEPVRKAELDVIRLEVSVLSPLESISFANEADLLEQLTPEKDGVVIIADGRRATLLPKAWDMFPEPHKFLAALKTKCGLPDDYWSDGLGFQRYRTKSYAEV